MVLRLERRAVDARFFRADRAWLPSLCNRSMPCPAGSSMDSNWTSAAFTPQYLSLPDGRPCVSYLRDRVAAALAAGASVRGAASRLYMSPFETLVVSRGTGGSKSVRT
jgi:hypothetical protein